MVFHQAAVYKKGREGKKVELIVIHRIYGSLTSADGTFVSGNRNNSAHYGVGWGGEIIQWVKDEDTAYHAGNWDVNLRSIGIEHQDNQQEKYTDAQYEASAQLVAGLCKKFGIPANRNAIRKHNEVSVKGTACPGEMDIDRIVNRASQIINGGNMPYPQDAIEQIKNGLSLNQYVSLIVERAIEGARQLAFGHIDQPGVEADRNRVMATILEGKDHDMKEIFIGYGDSEEFKGKWTDKAQAEASIRLIAEELSSARVALDKVGSELGDQQDYINELKNKVAETMGERDGISATLVREREEWFKVGEDATKQFTASLEAKNAEIEALKAKLTGDENPNAWVYRFIGYKIVITKES